MKRIISIFLAAVLLLSVCAVGVFAGGGINAADMYAGDISLYEQSNGEWVYTDDSGNPLSTPWYRYNIPLGSLEIQDEHTGNYYPYDIVIEWWDVWYEDFTIIDGQSAATPWGLGEHEVTVWYRDVSATFTVEIIPSPIQSFTVDPVTFVEGTHCYECWEDEETIWTRYEYETDLTYHVTMADGSTSTMTYYEVNSILGDSIAIFDDQCYEMPWGIGTHYGEIVLFGRTAEVEVRIIETPVAYIEAEDVEIIENTNCYTDTDYVYNEELGFFDEVPYTRYDYNPVLTVHYKNGDTVPMNWWDYGGDLSYADDQGLDNEWGLGTHEATVTYLGCSVTFKVNIVESPVSYIEAEDVTLIEGADCIEYTDYIFDFDIFDFVEKVYPRYHYYPTITVHYKDGSVETLSTRDVECTPSDDQSAEKPWGRGKHTGTINYLGVEAPVNITIVETPVSRLEIEPFTVIENKDGYTYTWDDINFTSCPAFFCYFASPEQITVYMKDGTVLSGDPDSLFEQTGYDCFMLTKQNYDTRWGLGEHVAEYSFMGATAPTTVTVVPHKDGCSCAEFTDAPAMSNWAHAGLEYAVEQGLLSGDGDGHLLPFDTTTRAMLVQILYNMVGRPAVTYSPKFSDVKSNNWFANAVLWAAENGIVSGVGDGTFDPFGAVTREQIALILFNFVKSEYGPQFYTPLALNGFSDGSTVSRWANSAMCWACKNNLISGKSNDGKILLDPQGKATRAEVASILMRFGW